MIQNKLNITAHKIISTGRNTSEVDFYSLKVHRHIVFLCHVIHLRLISIGRLLIEIHHNIITAVRLLVETNYKVITTCIPLISYG